MVQGVKPQSDMQIYATSGMLYNFSYANGELNIIPTDVQILQRLYEIKENLQPEDQVIIATDHDSAGEYIALELLDIFPKAKRYSKRIDDWVHVARLRIKEATTELLKDSSEEYFNESLAFDFLDEKLRRNPFREEKKKALLYYMTRNNKTTVIIPARYKNVIRMVRPALIT